MSQISPYMSNVNVRLLQKKCNEANQERDAAGKKCAASCRNNSLITANNGSKKRGCTENLCRHCQSKGYDVAWNPWSCNNFRHPNYQRLALLWLWWTLQHTQLLLFSEPLLWSIWLLNAIASQQLVIARAKVAMLNSTTNPDQEHNCNQGPILVILKPQDAIMVAIFMMMTTGEGIRKTQPLLSLCSRSDCWMSLPQAKSPPIQHQDLVVELKSMAMPPQDNEAIPKYAAPTKMQRATCASYSIPLPSPDSYTVNLQNLGRSH